MKFTFFALLAAMMIFIGVLVVGGGSSSTEGGGDTPAPRIENGKQIIEIKAKGGYTPQQTAAQANIPSVIRVKTQATFDCSAALLIPALQYSKYLPASGITEIPLPAQKPGTTLTGTCGMGMYSFAIRFS